MKQNHAADCSNIVVWMPEKQTVAQTGITCIGCPRDNSVFRHNEGPTLTPQYNNVVLYGGF